MKAKTKNLIEIHSAVFLFGLAGLFAKFLSLHPVIIVFGRVFFASITLYLILKFSKKSLLLRSTRDYIYLCLMGIVLALHWITFFHSIQISTVAIGLLTYSTFPIFVTFTEPLFFKEKLKPLNILIAALTFIGVGLVIPEFKLTNDYTQGALWGGLSGFLFAALSIFNRKYVKFYSSTVIAFYQDTVAAIILIPFLFILSPVLRANDILLLALLGVIFTAIAHSLFIKSMTNLTAHLASIIATLEPVYGIIFAFILLNEKPELKVILGGLIILSMTSLATRKFHNYN